jgi:hypothetical protein
MFAFPQTLHPRIRALVLACLILGSLAPGASAQDEPAFVFPCADGVAWTATAGQPIAFFCGWGTQGGPGLMETFLRAHEGTLVIEDQFGNVVLAIGPTEFAALWGDPKSGPSGFDDVTCAGPTGWGVGWSYLFEAGLPEGTYTITLDESSRHPVTDGFQSCWFEDGSRLAEPPDHLYRGSTAIGTIIVAD